ncbi:hypothetical protein JHK86_000699 [Glycine max]|nr:hypothetical protein JHK86_000699 [Glycine max]
MKTISGHCVPVKDILVSKAAKILTKFVSADNGASLVINAYLHRASASFNELKQLHKELGSSHSHKKHKRHITENGNDSGIISLDLPKVKNPAKGKVLMQAMYGVKVETLEAVDASVKILYPTIQAGVDIVEIEWLVKTVEELRAGVEKLSQGNDLLAKGVDGLFEAAMTSRDTLLSFVRFDKIVNDRSPGRNRDMQELHCILETHNLSLQISRQCKGKRIRLFRTFLLSHMSAMES